MDTTQDQSPSYAISRNEDGSLKWEPPQGSIELERALEFHFPHVKGLKFKILAARAKQIQEAAMVSRESRKQSNRHARSDSTRLPDAIFPFVKTLNRQTMEEVGGPSRRRPFKKGEKTEISRNRGMVCDTHRRNKLKCDPQKCPRNKLYQTLARQAPKGVLTKSHPHWDLMAFVLAGAIHPSVPLGDILLECLPSASGQEASETGNAESTGEEQEGHDEDDDRDRDGEGRKSNRRGDNPYEYGDWWRSFDEDPDGGLGPFDGGSHSSGGYPKPGGGYYSLKERLRKQPLLVERLRSG